MYAQWGQNQKNMYNYIFTNSTYIYFENVTFVTLKVLQNSKVEAF